MKSLATSLHRVPPEMRLEWPPLLGRGLDLMAEGRYFDAHRDLEAIWRQEPGATRQLYLGLCQASIFFWHLERGNHKGARLIHPRCLALLAPWPPGFMGLPLQEIRGEVSRSLPDPVIP